jgi:hypothetical protein
VVRTAAAASTTVVDGNNGGGYCSCCCVDDVGADRRRVQQVEAVDHDATETTDQVGSYK